MVAAAGRQETPGTVRAAHLVASQGCTYPSSLLVLSWLKHQDDSLQPFGCSDAGSV